MRSLTNLPVLVVNTHGHPDHAGGNGGFDEVYLHPADEPLMKRMCADDYRLNDLRAFRRDVQQNFSRLEPGWCSYQEVHLMQLNPKDVCFDLAPGSL